MDPKSEIGQSPDVFHEAEGILRKFDDAFKSIPQSKAARDGAIPNEFGEITFGFKKRKYFYIVEDNHNDPVLAVTRVKDYEEGESAENKEIMRIDVFTSEEGDENSIIYDDIVNDIVAGQPALTKAREMLSELQS